jgi:hypothetical protein
MVRVHLTKNSAIRKSTANFRLRFALARTGKPINEQDPWALYHYLHGSPLFHGVRWSPRVDVIPKTFLARRVTPRFPTDV